MVKWEILPDVDPSVEKKILTGLIVSNEFYKKVSSILDVKAFRSSYAQILGGWCVQYYKKYGEVPKEAIEEIFNVHKREENYDESDLNMIGKVLNILSKEYDGKNFKVDLLLDEAEKYFKKRSYEILKEELNVRLMNDDLEGCDHLIGSHKRVKKEHIEGIDLLNDSKAIIDAFNPDEDYLFKLDGELGRRFGPIKIGDFIGIFGPAGRGKSWWLLHFAIKALFSGLKVAFFSFEMTQNEFIRRAYQCFASLPLEESDIMIPIMDCKSNQDGSCNLACRKWQGQLEKFYFDIIEKQHSEIPEDYKPCDYCFKHASEDLCKDCYRFAPFFIKRHKKGLDPAEALKFGKMIDEMVISGQFHLACFPSSSKSIVDIDVYLDNLFYYENFDAHLVVTDYADRMKPVDKRKDHRNRIDDTWDGHRSMAQRRHCAVVTASHTQKETFEREIKQGDASEDIRKMNHITKGMSLNQTDIEKAMGIMHVGFLKKRHEGFSARKKVTLLQQLDMGKICMHSFYDKEQDRK